MTRYRGKAVLSVEGLGEAPCSIDMTGASVRAWPTTWTKDLHALPLPTDASLRLPSGAVMAVCIEDRAAFHGFLEMTVTGPAREAETKAAHRPRGSG